MTTLKTLRSLLSIALMTAVGFAAGCSKKTDSVKTGDKTGKTGAPDKHADPHDVPLTKEETAKLRSDVATYEQAVAHITKYRDTIKKETTDGTPAKAHRPLDLLDLVLKWLPEIAQKSNVPKDQWATVGSNAQKLRELFNKVHQNIDDGKPPKYDEVDAEVDKSVNALSAVKAK